MVHEYTKPANRRLFFIAFTVTLLGTACHTVTQRPVLTVQSVRHVKTDQPPPPATVHSPITYAYMGHAGGLTAEGKTKARVGAEFDLEMPTTAGDTLEVSASFEAMAEGITAPETANNMTPRTWKVSLQPGKDIRFLAGSVAFSGLPAKAANPMASDPAPFHLPSAPADDSLLAPADTSKTGRIAVEWHAAPLRAALLVANDRESPSFATATVVAGQSPRSTIEAAIYAGSRTDRPTPEDTWYPENPPLPERKQAVVGTEFTYRFGPTLGSATGLLSVDDLGQRSLSGSAEMAFETSFFSVSGGYASSGRGFKGMNGRPISKLERLFLAPSLSFLPLIPVFDTLRFGLSFEKSREKGVKVWKDDVDAECVQASIEGAFKAVNAQVAAQVDNDGSEVSASLETALPFPAAPRISISAAGLPDSLPPQYSGRAQLELEPLRAISLALSGEGSIATGQKGELSLIAARCVIGKDLDHELSISLMRELVESEERITIEAGLTVRVH